MFIISCTHRPLPRWVFLTMHLTSTEKKLRRRCTSCFSIILVGLSFFLYYNTELRGSTLPASSSFWIVFVLPVFPLYYACWYYYIFYQHMSVEGCSISSIVCMWVDLLRREKSVRISPRTFLIRVHLSMMSRKIIYYREVSSKKCRVAMVFVPF